MRVLRVAALVAVVGMLGCAGSTVAATSTVTRADGYAVTLSGPASAVVGVPAAYTATCGGAPCAFGEFRAFGSVINRLGEGFGRGAMGSWTPRSPGTYSIRYRVGAACVGSPNRACPIDVWLTTSVTL